LGERYRANDMKIRTDIRAQLPMFCLGGVVAALLIFSVNYTKFGDNGSPELLPVKDGSHIIAVKDDIEVGNFRSLYIDCFLLELLPDHFLSSLNGVFTALSCFLLYNVFSFKCYSYSFIMIVII
jgi:hypothetical protein